MKAKTIKWLKSAKIFICELLLFLFWEMVKLTKQLKNWINKQTVVKKIKEYGAIIIFFYLFYLSQFVIRWLDPTAGVYDTGVIQIINLSILMGAIFFTLGFLAFKTFWPDHYKFLKNDYSTAFNSLRPWQKILFSLVTLFFYPFCLVLLSIIVR